MSILNVEKVKYYVEKFLIAYFPKKILKMLDNLVHYNV